MILFFNVYFHAKHETIKKSKFFGLNRIPMSQLEQVILAEDEFEALRLADLLGMYYQCV